MGNAWGLLIPLTILMASLRHKKKGWWFQLHRALATLSLILVVIGVILGRRLRISHPPVTFAGKCHKVMGYSALAFIVIQVSCQQHLVSVHLACTYSLQGMCSCTCTAVIACIKVPACAELHMLFALFFMFQNMFAVPANQLVCIVLNIILFSCKCTLNALYMSCWLRYNPLSPFPESPPADQMRIC